LEIQGVPPISDFEKLINTIGNFPESIIIHFRRLSNFQTTFFSTTGKMPDESRWFKDGLKFECTQCGNCCTGAPGVVWVDDEELQAIAKFLEISVGEVRLMHTRLFGGRLSLKEYANGDCTFFDPESRKCSIYEQRPKQCRTWPFWWSNIHSEKTWKQTQSECPGAGRGNFVAWEEIVELANLIDM